MTPRARVHLSANATRWCGSEATTDRPPILTGRSIHAVYVYPSDRPNRLNDIAARLQGDVEHRSPGWECPPSCAADWDVGIPISLEASPADGMRLVRWEGSCSGDLPCQLPMTGAADVTALFAPETYPLVLSVTGKGAIVSSALAAACRTRCRVAAASYTPIRLVAKPARAGASGDGAAAARTPPARSR